MNIFLSALWYVLTNIEYIPVSLSKKQVTKHLLFPRYNAYSLKVLSLKPKEAQMFTANVDESGFFMREMCSNYTHKKDLEGGKMPPGLGPTMSKLPMKGRPK